MLLPVVIVYLHNPASVIARLFKNHKGQIDCNSQKVVMLTLRITRQNNSQAIAKRVDSLVLKLKLIVIVLQ